MWSRACEVGKVLPRAGGVRFGEGREAGCGSSNPACIGGPRHDERGPPSAALPTCRACGLVAGIRKASGIRRFEAAPLVSPRPSLSVKRDQNLLRIQLDLNRSFIRGNRTGEDTKTSGCLGEGSLCA